VAGGFVCTEKESLDAPPFSECFDSRRPDLPVQQIEPPVGHERNGLPGIHASDLLKITVILT
jgi:hypothetical protein